MVDTQSANKGRNSISINRDKTSRFIDELVEKELVEPIGSPPTSSVLDEDEEFEDYSDKIQEIDQENMDTILSTFTFSTTPTSTVTYSIYDGEAIQKLVSSLLKVVQGQQQTINAYENRFTDIENDIHDVHENNEISMKTMNSSILNLAQNVQGFVDDHPKEAETPRRTRTFSSNRKSQFQRQGSNVGSENGSFFNDGSPSRNSTRKVSSKTSSDSSSGEKEMESVESERDEIRRNGERRIKELKERVSCLMLELD